MPQVGCHAPLIVKAVIDAFRPGSFVGSHNEWTLIGLRINSVFDVDIDDGEVERTNVEMHGTADADGEVERTSVEMHGAADDGQDADKASGVGQSQWVRQYNVLKSLWSDGIWPTQLEKDPERNSLGRWLNSQRTVV